jgi:hypothetical protein
MSNSAARLTNQLFQEDWASTPQTDQKPEGKISYLMVEQIAPPENLWEKISKKLDQQEGIVSQPIELNLVTSRKAIVLMLASAAATVALILYWLV